MREFRTGSSAALPNSPPATAFARRYGAICGVSFTDFLLDVGAALDFAQLHRLLPDFARGDSPGE